jgi:hypothetical protein
MCTTCGCGTGETRVEGKALAEPGNSHEGNGGNPPAKPLVNDQGQEVPPEWSTAPSPLSVAMRITMLAAASRPMATNTAPGMTTGTIA